LALWDSPRQREAYTWFGTELANLRTAFRWAAGHGDLDVAATIATYASLLGVAIENYEPTTWAEELIEPARSVDHPRLATLYAMAATCYIADVSMTPSATAMPARSFLPGAATREVRGESLCGAAYLAGGQFERSVQFFRTRLAARRDAQVFLRTVWYSRSRPPVPPRRVDATDGLIEAAEAASNPYMHSLALSAAGLALVDADPVRALGALRRGLVIAQDSANRFTESILAIRLSALEAEHRDLLAALEHVTLAIRNCHDSDVRRSSATRSPTSRPSSTGSDATNRQPRSPVSHTVPHRIGSSSIGATITHLRAILGDHTYESLAQKGELMTAAAMAEYAYDQIDQVRAALRESA
jgi:hypothetical protein